jgi:hypothetical protein
MRALHKQHIVDVFVWVDDTLPKQKKTGPHPVLSDSELITILIWDGLTEPHKNLSAVYSWIKREYHDCFPKLPAYQNFVAQCHRLLPSLGWLLQSTLSTSTPLRFADSTMLPVCKLIRADRHKVAKGIADFGKNWQGWHYGFKLHVSIDHESKLSALYFTPANEADVLQLKYLVNNQTRVVVADAGYTAKVTRWHIWRDFHCIVISPPRPRQVWMMANWQHLLLQARPKIEAVFGKLKEKNYLVSSFPRSVKGYFVHYLRVLLGYQLANS